MADGTEGRISLELANAIVLASHLGCLVDLPFDRVAYHEFLDARSQASQPSET